MPADGRQAWFSGDEPRTGEEEAFLSALRRSAQAWDVPLLEPAQTHVSTVLVPLHVSVGPLSGLPEDRNLQVGYWSGPLPGPRLEGEWGNEWLLDSRVRGPDGLMVDGLRGDPAEFGGWAARWLLDQVRRPVERHDWLDRRGGVATSRWRLADTGLVIAQTGRSRLRPADRIGRVR